MAGGSRHARHTRRLEATKEIFYPCTCGDDMTHPIGSYAGALIDGDEEDAWITGYVPWNFKKIEEIVLVVIPLATGTMTFTLNSDYAPVGFPFDSTHEEAILRTFEAVTNDITEIDVRTSFDARIMTAKDYFGLMVTRQAGQNTDFVVLGVRIKYNIPIA